jgi:hypothetical protein
MKSGGIQLLLKNKLQRLSTGACHKVKEFGRANRAHKLCGSLISRVPVRHRMIGRLSQQLFSLIDYA